MKNLDLSDFKNVSKNDWVELAKAQLKNDDPISHLSWQTDTDLSISPYYDQSDLEGLSYLEEFFDTMDSHLWKLYEPVYVIDEIEANEKALEALEGGCDGVVFHVENEVSFEKLLKNILPEICDLSLISKKDGLDLNFNLPDFSGFIITDSVKTAELPIQSESQIGQMKSILDGDNYNKIIRYASKDFFLEVASVRALRFLVSTAKKIGANDVKIHSIIPSHEEPEYQGFYNATSGLASILGGSNSVEFTTVSGPTRISRNVGNIIREECGIVEYHDQCRGSYYIEAITHQIIEKFKSYI